MFRVDSGLIIVLSRDDELRKKLMLEDMSRNEGKYYYNGLIDLNRNLEKHITSEETLIEVVLNSNITKESKIIEVRELVGNTELRELEETSLSDYTKNELEDWLLRLEEETNNTGKDERYRKVDREVKESLRNIKSNKKCTSCNTELRNQSKYCDMCGKKYISRED